MKTFQVVQSVSQNSDGLTHEEILASGVLVLSWPGHLVLNLYSRGLHKPRELSGTDSQIPSLCYSRSPSLSRQASILRAATSPSNSPTPSHLTRSRSPQVPSTPTTPRYSQNIIVRYYEVLHFCGHLCLIFELLGHGL